MKSELEQFINDNKEAFYSRTPNPAVLERLQQQLKETNGKKKEKASVISLKFWWAAAACLLLVAGGVAYLTDQKTETQQAVVIATKRIPPLNTPSIGAAPKTEDPETVAPSQEASAATAQLAPPRINTIKDEEYQSRMALFTNMSDVASPSRRLAAVYQAEELTSTDNDIVDALAKTMNSDPNTNVRLAALDALSKFYREPYVKKKLVASLKKQKDPMVQIALIELLTKMKEESILNQLNKMVSDDNNMQAVKDQAYSGILKFRSL